MPIVRSAENVSTKWLNILSRVIWWGGLLSGELITISHFSVIYTAPLRSKFFPNQPIIVSLLAKPFDSQNGFTDEALYSTVQSTLTVKMMSFLAKITKHREAKSKILNFYHIGRIPMCHPDNNRNPAAAFGSRVSSRRFWLPNRCANFSSRKLLSINYWNVDPRNLASINLVLSYPSIKLWKLALNNSLIHLSNQWHVVTRLINFPAP